MRICARWRSSVSGSVVQRCSRTERTYGTIGRAATTVAPCETQYRMPAMWGHTAFMATTTSGCRPGKSRAIHAWSWRARTSSAGESRIKTVSPCRETTDVKVWLPSRYVPPPRGTVSDGSGGKRRWASSRSSTVESGTVRSGASARGTNPFVPPCRSTNRWSVTWPLVRRLTDIG